MAVPGVLNWKPVKNYTDNLTKNLKAWADQQKVLGIVANPPFGGNNNTGIGKSGLGIPIDEVDDKVLKEIYPSDDGVFGYLPEPGTRYDKPKFDFTDIDRCIKNQDIRLDYLKETETLRLEVDKMLKEGKSNKEIADYVVNQRNQQKIDARTKMTPDEVVDLELGNMEKYKNPVGPTPQDLFVEIQDKYLEKGIELDDDEIWGMVIKKSFRKDAVLNTLLGIK